MSIIKIKQVLKFYFEMETKLRKGMVLFTSMTEISNDILFGHLINSVLLGFGAHSSKNDDDINPRAIPSSRSQPRD